MAQVVGSEPVTMKKNPRYKADGRKAYLKAVRKWKFDPPYINPCEYLTLGMMVWYFWTKSS